MNLESGMFDLQSEILKINNTRPGMPLVMGILNVTPDSFSDGGLFVDQKTIEARVVQLIEEGVDIIDVGGESTRPGALEVPLEVELQRVIPVIEWIKSNFNVPVSIDTYKTEVMSQAITKGIDIVNDVNALQSQGALELVAKAGVSVCLMHKKGNAKNMQDSPAYVDVVSEVMEFLLDRASICEAAGVNRSRIFLDPGFGFGKDLKHNTALFNEMSNFVELPYPLLVGVSRKRMIGEILDNVPVDERLIGSVAAALLAGMKGASIVRVHDVKPTIDALRVVAQLL